MTLGLESEGFELVFANELSPMAGETFAYNLLGEDGEDLRELADSGEPARQTFWLNSKHARNELDLRLRENPREAPAPGQGHNDLEDDDAHLHGGLLVGDIIALNNYLEQDNPALLEQVRHAFDHAREVDLVSGGPPCQSFSMAGLRQHDNERNQLPAEFARFVGLVEPRMVVLENVSGILHAFNVEGEKHYAWYEVAKAFVGTGYVPLCLHVNAKYAGAAQNRPRFIMLAMRRDVFGAFLAHEQANEHAVSVDMLQTSLAFYNAVEANPELAITGTPFTYHDIEKHRGLFNDTFLSPLINRDPGQLHTVADAIADLSQELEVPASEYVDEINALLPGREPPAKAFNHEMRRHTPLVKRRFSLYQALSRVSTRTRRQVGSFLRTDDTETLTREAIEELDGIHVLGANEDWDVIQGREQLVTFLRALSTKKQTQKALVADEPAPAALSIPDDACHYNPGELRLLSVREMARIQSFPDWFKLRSKVTTGGQMRRFEVPQYTQIGNAVPPLLGRAIGQVVNRVLAAVDQQVEGHEVLHQLVVQQPLLDEVAG